MLALLYLMTTEPARDEHLRIDAPVAVIFAQAVVELVPYGWEPPVHPLANAAAHFSRHWNTRGVQWATRTNNWHHQKAPQDRTDSNQLR